MRTGVSSSGVSYGEAIVSAYTFQAEEIGKEVHDVFQWDKTMRKAS